MKLIVEIPKEFEGDFKSDRFFDFFMRVGTDCVNGDLVGNYEREMLDMMTKAFSNATVYDENTR